MVSGFSIAAVVAAAVILAMFWWRKGYMVQGIVLANFAVFILMVAAGQVSGNGFGTISGSPFLKDLSFRGQDLAGPWGLLRIVTASFLHADLVHIIGNMLILLMVGLAFEDRIGRGRFVVIYLFTAVTGALLHVVYLYATLGSVAGSIPMVGASAAVFGILAAFATTYPHDRIPMWLLFIVLPRVRVIVAALVLMLAEIFLFALGPASSVAHVAHLGGAVGGVVAGPLLRGHREAGQRADSPQRIDIDRLAERAATPTQQQYVGRLRENLDEPETAKAWLERLALTLTCTQCGKNYQSVRGTRLRCPDGHEDRYERTT